MRTRRSHQQEKRRDADPAQLAILRRNRAQFRLAVLLGLLVLLVGTVWFSGALGGVPRAIARQAAKQRDYDRAWYWIGIASWLSTRDPANAVLGAGVARGQGDADRLSQQIENARRWGADPKAIRREELLARAQAGQLDGIEEEIVELLGEGGDQTAEVSEAYANGLAMVGRFEDAMRILDAWRLDFPNDPRPNYRLARIQEHQKSYTEAEENYRESLAKDAGYFPARYSLGRVLVNRRRADEALEQFQLCLQAPHPEAAKVEMAIGLKALGRMDEARTLLKQVLEADPDELRASYVALDEQPELLKAASEYGRLEADTGNFAEAERWLTKALEANPQDLMARYAFAVTLRGLGKKAEADQQFSRVSAAREALSNAGALNARIQRDPADIDARFKLGKMVLEHESERTGLYLIRSIFAYDPDYGPAHELLADYYASQSQKDRGNSQLARHHRKMAEASRTKATTP